MLWCRKPLHSLGTGQGGKAAILSLQDTREVTHRVKFLQERGWRQTAHNRHPRALQVTNYLQYTQDITNHSKTSELPLNRAPGLWVEAQVRLIRLINTN